MRGLIPMLAALVILGSCSSTRKDLTVPLTFRPEREVPPETRITPPPASRFYLAPITDDRPDKTRIGENTEVTRKPARPVYSSGPSPAEFLGSILAHELSAAGVASVPDPSQANRVLSIRLIEFFTTEGERYKTSIRAQAEVRDGAGQPLWSAPLSGASERFGSSLSVENYNEGFSDAALELISSLINDAGFQRVLAIP